MNYFIEKQCDAPIGERNLKMNQIDQLNDKALMGTDQLKLFIILDFLITKS